MRNLKTLSVCYCGLTDLDGINNLPSLVNLVAAFISNSGMFINEKSIERKLFEEYTITYVLMTYIHGKLRKA